MTILKNVFWTLMFIGGMAFYVMSFFIIVDMQKDRTIVYDCRMSEISPDFPIEVRNECRRIRSGQRI